MATLIQQMINALTLGCIYGLVGLGYTMVYGVLRMVNFAHGELFMWGSMIAFMLLNRMGVVESTGLAVVLAEPLGGTRLVMVLAICFLGATLFSGIIGVIMERLTLRPLTLRGASSLILLISSLGSQFVLRNVAMLIVRAVKGFPRLIPTRSFQIGGAYFSNMQVIVAMVSGLLLGGLLYFVNRTYMGRSIRAVAEDRDAASLMGIDVNRTYALVFFIGPGIGAFSAVLCSMYLGYVHYYMGAVIGMKGWTAAVLGGVGNIPGAAVAGLLLAILETVGGGYLPVITRGLLGTDYKDIFAFIILVFVLVLRPQGLFGEAVETE